MKAIKLTRYGSPKDLTLAEVPKPIPKDNQVLVKIHAASVNDWDWGMVRGKPFYIRLLCGFWKPKILIPGVDISGTVEAIGKQVTRFQVGAAVYGDLSDNGFGGFAEYVCVEETALTLKPKNMSFIEAAALPHAAGLAVQSLITLGKMKAGKKILVNGAGGGFGTLAAQLAISHEASELTGVDAVEKIQTMTKVGFQKTLDYKNINFTHTGERYDLILDAKTCYNPFAYRRALHKGGSYITVGGHTGKLFLLALWGLLSNRLNAKKLKVLTLKPNEGLNLIHELYEAGKLYPIMDSPHYSLDQVPEALELFGKAHHKGKIMIKIV